MTDLLPLGKKGTSSRVQRCSRALRPHHISFMLAAFGVMSCSIFHILIIYLASSVIDSNGNKLWSDMVKRRGRRNCAADNSKKFVFISKLTWRKLNWVGITKTHPMAMNLLFYNQMQRFTTFVNSFWAESVGVDCCCTKKFSVKLIRNFLYFSVLLSLLVLECRASRLKVPLWIIVQRGSKVGCFRLQSKLLCHKSSEHFPSKALRFIRNCIANNNHTWSKLSLVILRAMKTDSIQLHGGNEQSTLRSLSHRINGRTVWNESFFSFSLPLLSFASSFRINHEDERITKKERKSISSQEWRKLFSSVAHPTRMLRECFFARNFCSCDIVVWFRGFHSQLQDHCCSGLRLFVFFLAGDGNNKNPLAVWRALLALGSVTHVTNEV